MSEKTPSTPQSEDLKSMLESLENRISGIEEFLNYKLNANLGKQQPREDKDAEIRPRISEEAAESQFGEKIFAWISSIVVLFLVVFIMLFFQNQNKDGQAILVGYLATGAVLLITYLIRKSFPRQVYLLKIACHILLFYITLYLHFFSETPIIENNVLGIAVMALPILYLFNFAFRKNSENLVILGSAMVITTAIFSDNTFVMLGLLSVIAAFSLYLNYLKGWSKHLHLMVILVYTSHLLWFLGNPIAGNAVEAVENHQGNLFFLFSYGFVFSMIALLKPKTGFTQSVVTSITVMNGILFAMVLLLVINTQFKDNYSLIFAAITAFSLAYSAYLKIRSSHFFITSFYAVVSFVAMSVMIYGFTGFPGAFIWLVLQSLLVVSIALWFRVPLIVVANILMFVGIMAFYLLLGEFSNSTNLVLAFVALLTARIINWQKERLNLKTEAIRNTYLISGFLATLFAFYHLFPDKYITISWVGATGIFFGLSYILKAKKYRWMAFATLIASVIYLFFFQLKSMELGFRIIAFLVIAVITLVASFYYSKRSGKNE